MNAFRRRRSLLPLGLLACLALTGVAAAEMPLVREVQERLAALGYDPGPVDGIAGERTRVAIMAFERYRNVPTTGDASPDLLQLLRVESASADAGSPMAAEEPNEAPGATSPLTGTSWKIRDENGAAFPVTFEPDGRVSSPGLGRGWSWAQDGHELRLTYDNRVGGRSTRSGVLLSAHEMAGTGESSRGREWTWQASRTK